MGAVVARVRLGHYLPMSRWAVHHPIVALIAWFALLGGIAVAAIGYGGATALDFTLPVIQKSGGIQVVPVAIVSGFIMSLLGPILILAFLAI